MLNVEDFCVDNYMFFLYSVFFMLRWRAMLTRKIDG